MTINPTRWSAPDLTRDYGLLTIHEYFNPWYQTTFKPTNCEDENLTTTWTIRYELGLPLPKRPVASTKAKEGLLPQANM